MKNINQMPPRLAMGLPQHYVSGPGDELSAVLEELRSAPAAVLAGIAENPSEAFHRRLAAGTLLGLIGDPRLSPFDPPMVSIPAGTATLGLPPERVDEVVDRFRALGVRREWIEKETPAFSVSIEPFRLGRYLVTNGEYRLFLLESRYPELPTSWRFGAFPHERTNHPVHTVSAEAAEAYAAWLSAKTGRRFRLPTEPEWEYASAGPAGWEYPWGDDFRPFHCNTIETGLASTTPVGLFPSGRSSFGCLDMAGNVEEYVLEPYQPYPGGRWVEDDLFKANPRYRMTRGGSFTRFADLARCRRRHGAYPSELYAIGFRLAETVAAPAPAV